MSRLTEKNWRNLDPWECCGQDDYCKRGCHDEGGCNSGCIVPKLYKRLAVLEDAEEQGRLIVLPCNVGDAVYYIDGEKSYKAKAVTFRINESGVRVYCERNFMGYIGFEGIYGKTVFLSREEAEKALDNMKEE